jgi:hypothetical protein
MQDRSEYFKAYRKANKERIAAYENAWREENRDKEKARVKAWREDNIDKVYASNAKRRAARINRTPSWLTKEDLDRIESIYKEAQKKKEETGEEWHVDHIIPLQGENISGLHVPDNLQVIRATENIIKKNRYEV